ncbi:MAG: phenylacetate--CoA ligase family protein [Candidatus Andersenbacteria bacterium]
MEHLPFPLEVYPPAIKGERQSIEFQGRFTKRLFEDFWDFSIDNASTALEEKESTYWEQKGVERALELFHAAAERVPAYKDFLKKQDIKPALIQTSADFKKIPTINKKNYLQLYPMEALLWDGQLSDAQIIAVSSGSSGEPFFWPRGGLLELETTYVQELYLKKIFHIDQYTTLYLDCFAMGMYIAGPIILNSALRISQKGYPMTVLTPGLSMDDIMRVIPNLGPHFEQIVIAGYPPYVKDIIEEAAKRGVQWHNYKVRLLLAGEGFSEQWRDHVAELAGGINVHDSIINIYGTADASIVGHETPESVTIRRLADQNEQLRTKLFNDRYQGRLPTFVQYLPTQKYFEVIDHELHFTATSGIPLVRYNIHDDGGIVTYKEAINFCEESDTDITKILKEKASGTPFWKLPFVYLYGRSDFTVVLYGANIYPENIKAALESEEIRKLVTGRFIMTIEHQDNQDPYLFLRIELTANIAPKAALQKKIQAAMISTLLAKNDEYRSTYHAKGKQAWPVIELYEKGNGEYFSRNRNKQQWTKK